jgi:hypothetical protein
MDVPDVPGLKGKAAAVNRFARLGAAGLIMLDPLNRLADDFITIPIPMIAIPAHESHLLSGSPSMQIYIRAGETIVPTGGNVQDFEQGVAETQALRAESVVPVPKKRKPTKYQRVYKKHFKAQENRPDYKKKDGTWKKGGFKRCVKAAHAKAKKELK